jgi:uncharacterized protein
MSEPPSFDASASPREFVPVSGPERIFLLDLLRGLAMFGVLWSNLNDWYGTSDPVRGLQHVLAWTQDSLIESRFYSLLAFLFGIGFAMQLTRAESRGVDVRAMFCRRMAALLGIGIVHGMLIWRGDILTAYALVGLLLVFFRRLSPRALVVWAAILLVVSPYVVRAVVIGFGVSYPKPPATAQVDAIYAHGTFAEIITMGARGYLFWYRRWPFTVFPPFLALFLLGLAAVRANLLERLVGARRQLIRILAASIVATVVFGYLDAHLSNWWPQAKTPPPLLDALFRVRTFRPLVIPTIYNLWTWSNACAYAAAMALLVSVPAWARRLEPLAAVGRMSLTTYLTQSLISVTLFYHYGFGLYGRLGHDGVLGITVTVFALQMCASVWWLRRFRFGPMEWLWRSAAYGKAQPMRRREPGIAAAAA